VPDDTAAKLAPDDALQMLAQAFEMDWNTVHADDLSETGTWPMGRTIWFALFVSAAIWAGIAGIVWLA
jgi:hypothetical protein